jgi:predicted nucleic acid-binding protein
VILLDTSAIYALLDRADANHALATRTMGDLRQEGLLTHSYVVVETSALAQHRLGLGAVRALHDDLLPVVEVEWVTEEAHRAAYSALLASGERRVSLVDHVSFEVMRRLRVRQAFAFDPDFAVAGFELLPEPA